MPGDILTMLDVEMLPPVNVAVGIYTTVQLSVAVGTVQVTVLVHPFISAATV